MIANPEPNHQSAANENDYLHARLVPVSIALYQAIAAIVLIAVASSAFGWLRTPLGSAQFSKPDQVSQLIIPWIVGAINLGCGIWVFILQQRNISSRIFAVLSASTAMAMAVFFDVQSANRLGIVWFLGVIMAAGSLFHLALVFPTRISKSEKWNFLTFLGYGLSLVLFLIALLLIFESNRSGAILGIQRLSLGWLGIAILSFMATATLRQLSANSLLVRQRGRIVYLGIILSLLPFMIWALGRMIRPGIWLSPIVFIPLALFPLSVAYAILRYRLPGTDYILSRVFMYGLLTVVAVSGYALIVSGLSLIFGEMLGLSNPISAGLVFFLLAISLNPLRDYLQRLVDAAFFRGQLAYQERVRIFGQDLTTVLDLKEIGHLLRKHVEETLAPSQLHIFLPDPAQEYFVALPSETGESTTDLRFAQISALPTMLSHNPTYVFIGNDGELPPALEGEKARLALLAAQVFVPLVGRGGSLTGFMALSSRRSGEPYTNKDLDFLTSLSEQTAISIERSQVVADLERRVNEMNVLMRVAEGINITPQFDDILELIYAQTNRLIPLRDFWILLYDSDRALYRYVFYLEDDIRLLKYENRPIEMGKGLSQEVVRTRRIIVTDDYERECRQRGLLPLVEGLYSWAGVPLNAGAETIGSLSLGSRDISVVFSREHLDMLQAIADQAAGAIVKTRLLQETERRARQLGLINEIGRTLTSTLDLPNLLTQVLDNAVEIINCEAGTLFLVDEDSGELIFEVVTGPVADELIGQRLAPGTGHVGQAVNTAQPAIVNQVNRTAEWSSNPDQSTGFQTRDLLLAPMVVKENVIGVIEVINRRDGAPFTEDDQDLLTAFAGQAGIAVENARLYTLTDQQLAARVDELSVMQRIDRELNASLDIQRAMRITLSWAMNQSGADAGFVGSIEEGYVQIMADQGYDQELTAYQQGQLPLDHLTGLRNAVSMVETQITQRSSLDGNGAGNQNGLLMDMKSQLVYPIRREDQVIGVMLLESVSDVPWAEDIQEFLSRLSDHAAIAIANAQLFAQVRAADVAKNDFISFVAHELKTPMTSIRGYTDLLMGGAMGEISDGQSNFLQTIRSNVTRMATLVSDLSDISRIEAGRLRLEFEAVNVANVVEESSNAQGHSIDLKEQELDLHLPQDLPAVWCDRVRLVQILVNLISNANKYSPEGGHIKILALRMENQWDPGGAAEVVRFAVEDDGIGMTQEDQEKIFSKFFRSENPDARQSPGSGLGLNITKNLIEMQGGTIWFESAYGQGTTFFFTIPVAQV
jgi:signal transduction histidine kinase